MHAIEIVEKKIISGNDLERWLAIARFRRQKLVFTNGCFDVLHKGHVEYLAKASDLGDLLIVGLNNDISVTQLKGPSRPYLDEGARALILASLRFVSAVVLFSEQTPYNLIKQIQPHVLVKGNDYKAEDIVGYDIVTSLGGKVITVELTEGYSSTGILGKITGSRHG
jgi:rfaE bifunctional protein nucleotidyltransferase chain/domain